MIPASVLMLLLTVRPRLGAILAYVPGGVWIDRPVGVIADSEGGRIIGEFNVLYKS